jgi:DNA-binding transcriptional MerR regulator
MATTSEVARLLSVTSATIRNCTQELADHVSPAATPPLGKKRSFTDEDMAVLSAAKSLLAEGLTYAEADERLSAVGLEEFGPKGGRAGKRGNGPGVGNPAVHGRPRPATGRLDRAHERFVELEPGNRTLQGRLETVTRSWWAADTWGWIT